MKRYLDYGICLDEGQDMYLIRRMSLSEGRIEGEGEPAIAEPGDRFFSHHRYVLKSGELKIRLTTAELDLLHEAIHEMLRMHDTHADALTDGASVGAGEPKSQITLCDGERSVLGHLSDGAKLYCKNAKDTFHLEVDDTAYVHRGYISTLLDNRLIEPINPSWDSVGRTYYAITNEGRRVLAEADDDG